MSVFGDLEIDNLHAEDGFFEVEYYPRSVRYRYVSASCRSLLVNDLLTCGINKLDCSLAHLGLEVDLFGNVSRGP